MEKFQANDRPIYSKAYRLMQQISLNDATQRQLSSVNSINASSLAAVNEEIDKLLRTSKKRREKELLVALMGHDNEPSRFLTQIKILHHDGYSNLERKEMQRRIHQDMIEDFRIIVSTMESQNLEFENKDNSRNAEYIKSEQHAVEECFSALRSILFDKSVQAAISNGIALLAPDSTEYFMKHFDRVAMEGYLPTNEDIGNMRTAYRCGISEHVFDFKDLALRLFNVGSNNSIGRRWWHVFDNVQVLIYVIPLDEYDQILPEMIEGGGNYLRAKIESFSFIANSPFYQEAALIVFFTRVSQFQERLSAKTSPVSNHWPGYHGAPTDVLAAQNFFKTKIRNVPEDPKRKIYVHFINTTDANVLDKVKASMDDVVAQRKLDAVHEDTLVASEKDA